MPITPLYINDFISKTNQGILLQFSGSVSESNFASKFAGIIRKYECSFKGMTRKYLGHRFKNYQHNSRLFIELWQATVFNFRHGTCCFMWINISCIHKYGWLGCCMRYTQNETPTWSVFDYSVVEQVYKQKHRLMGLKPLSACFTLMGLIY